MVPFSKGDEAATFGARTVTFCPTYFCTETSSAFYLSLHVLDYSTYFELNRSASGFAASPCFQQNNMAEDERKRFLEGNEMELGEKQGRFSPVSAPRSPAPPKYTPVQTWQNNPVLPVISYCGSSILMTVANKYILSFPDYNLNFFLLAVQVSVSRQCRVNPTDCSRPLSVLLPSQHASKPASSPTETSRQMKQRNVRILTRPKDGLLTV